MLFSTSAGGEVMGVVVAFRSFFNRQTQKPSVQATNEPSREPLRGTFLGETGPEGMCCAFRDVKVVGITQPTLEAAALDFILAGRDRRLELERELPNPYNRNAIRVFAIWNGKREPVGYVPREIAARIANEYAHRRLAAVPVMVYPPQCDYQPPGIRFDIYVSSEELRIIA